MPHRSERASTELRSPEPVGGRGHYSYTSFSDSESARTFDIRRFGGPIGELVASLQAQVVARMAGRVYDRPILDVGTGTGRAALRLARAGARVTGLDASEQMLAVARERAANEGLDIRFVVGDAHALDFPDRAFHTTVSLRVLMHALRWRDCLAELCRVSERLVIIDYPSVCSLPLVQSTGRRLLHRVGVRTEHYRVFSDREIAEALGQSGFRVRSVHRQFVLPIALHKAVGSPRFTMSSEAFLQRLGLAKLFGSPVTLVAERCEIS